MVMCQKNREFLIKKDYISDQKYELMCNSFMKLSLYFDDF